MSRRQCFLYQPREREQREKEKKKEGKEARQPGFVVVGVSTCREFMIIVVLRMLQV
jgi:hypothetical protein